MIFGNGNFQRRRYDVSGIFDSIVIDGTLDVVLTEGNDLSIEIETDENLHNTEAIQVAIVEDTLKLQNCDCHSTKMIGYIQYPASQPLRDLNLSGTGSMMTTNEITSLTELFTVTINGTRKVNLKLNARGNLEIEMNGTSNLSLAGSVEQMTNINQNGTTVLDASQCKMTQVTAFVQGVSKAYIVAQDQINVNVQGVSSVFYRGPLKETFVGSITCKVEEF